jgi:hypothetical protein
MADIINLTQVDAQRINTVLIQFIIALYAIFGVTFVTILLYYYIGISFVILIPGIGVILLITNV